MLPGNRTCPKCRYYLSRQQALKKNNHIGITEEKNIKEKPPKPHETDSGQKKTIRHFRSVSKIVKRVLASGSHYEEKYAHLKQIKQAFPLVPNLHPSFWENPKFLRWQLMRLNKKYRDDVDAYWKSHWPWDSSYFQDSKFKNKFHYEWVLANFKDPKYLYEDILSFFKDFPPNGGEHYFDWRNRLGQFNDQFLYGILGMSLLGCDLVWLINRHNFGKTLPLPWTLRFPCPMFLNEIPGPRKAQKRRGRPQAWGFNLLIYELSQAGMINMEIVRLLFGIQKSTENYPNKESVLVRINTIKKTIGEAVSQAYQEIDRENIPSLTYRFSPEKLDSPIAVRYNRLYMKTVRTLPPIEA